MKTLKRIYFVFCLNDYCITSLLRKYCQKRKNDNICSVHQCILSTKEDIDSFCFLIRKKPGNIIYHISDDILKKYFSLRMKEDHISSCDLYDCIDFCLYNISSSILPYHDRRYAAFEFNNKHDDGAFHEDVKDANVIIIGVSRTAKTPTCLYLAYHGIKAANVPFVSEEYVEDYTNRTSHIPKVGFYSSVANNYHHRMNRFSSTTHSLYNSYTNSTQEEMARSVDFFRRREIFTVDTTYLSIEQTAKIIIEYLNTLK